MTGVIATLPKFQFSNAIGLPLSGGTLTSYLAGTTTPVTTYQDQALTIANTNPISLDSRGECLLWLDSTKTYKFVLKSALGVTQWTVDNITNSTAFAKALDMQLRADLAAPSGPALMGYSGTLNYVVATIGAALHDVVLNPRMFPWLAKLDGTTDDLACLQAALDYTPDGESHCILDFPAGSEAFIVGSLKFRRGSGIRGASGTGCIIRSASNLPIVTFRSLAGRTVMGCSLENVRIEGSASALDTLQDGIECAGGASHCSFKNVEIVDVGGIGLNFNSKDHLGTDVALPMGMLYSNFDNVSVTGARTAGAYFKGNSAQNVFTKLHITKLYGEAGIIFDGAFRGNNPFVNTFIGGGIERDGVQPTNVNYKCVWFKNVALAAQQTEFQNFYLEPGLDDSLLGVGDVSGYYVEQCEGLNISGMISFLHWGVRATTDNAKGIKVNGVRWFQSTSWLGGTTANLSGKAKISTLTSGVRVYVGPGSSSLQTGITWPDIAEAAAGTVTGFRYFDTAVNANKQCNIDLKGNNPSIASTSVAGRDAATIALQSLKLDGITNATRLQIGGGADVASVYLKDSALKFDGIASADAGVNSWFLDSADSVMKFKNFAFVAAAPALKVGVPASATASGITGQYAVSSTYVYFCIAANTWVRTAVTTF